MIQVKCGSAVGSLIRVNPQRCPLDAIGRSRPILLPTPVASTGHRARRGARRGPRARGDGDDGRPQSLVSPPNGPVFPLSPGKTWTTQTTMTVYQPGATGQASMAFPLESRWAVHDFEQVTVPAGTFRAIRFSVVDRVRDAVWHDNTYWYAPEVRTVVKVVQRRAPTHPIGPGTQEFELVELPKTP